MSEEDTNKLCDLVDEEYTIKIESIIKNAELNSLRSNYTVRDTQKDYLIPRIYTVNLKSDSSDNEPINIKLYYNEKSNRYITEIQIPPSKLQIMYDIIQNKADIENIREEMQKRIEKLNNNQNKLFIFTIKDKAPCDNLKTLEYLLN